MRDCSKRLSILRIFSPPIKGGREGLGRKVPREFSPIGDEVLGILNATVVVRNFFMERPKVGLAVIVKQGN